MKFFLSLLLTLLIAPHSFPSATVIQNEEPLVLNVTVTTKKGIVIRDLTLDDFSVTVDNQPRKILSLTNLELPASIGVLIDTSGSQSIGVSKEAFELRQQFKQGLEGFFKKSNPDNEYFALAFNSKTELVQDWTSNYQSILDKFDSLTYRKATSLYDALRSGIEMMNRSRNSRHVLILISDGVDTNSKASFRKVRDALKGSDVVLYCVGLKNDVVFDSDGAVVMPDELEAERLMKELAFSSGGRMLFTKNSEGLKGFNEVFELIALELRGQYQLVIAPDSANGNRKWHKLKVAINKDDAADLLARTRQGYYR